MARSRRKAKPSTLPIGPVSEGTHRAADLIPRFMAAADTLKLHPEHRGAIIPIKTRIAIGMFMMDDLEELTLILEDYVAPFTYFGTPAGDGASFGVWIEYGELQEAENDNLERTDTLIDMAARKKAGETIPDYNVVVNERGNMTLYERRRHGKGYRWVEVWSVV